MTIEAEIAGLPPHSLQDRRTRVFDALSEAGLDRLVLASNGLHMIDAPNPVFHLTGFKSVGPCFVVLERDGSVGALGAPGDDGDRLAQWFDGRGRATDAIGDDVGAFLGRRGRTGHVGSGALPHRLGKAAVTALGEGAIAFDAAFYGATAVKTTAEIRRALAATRIAEAGYAEMRRLARPGMRECDLAVNLFMKELGADDSFLMLNAAPRADAVMPSSERLLESGDLILAELSPSVGGQFVQICRTVTLGESKVETRGAYDLLVEAMTAGIMAARPGARLAEVCETIDKHMTRAGYGEFSRPPFIRRRGHGLGAGSVAPGDVAVDNAARLETGMLFVVHPNQFLPATGYMMCGEPLVVGREGPIVLSSRRARLDREEPAS
jgi:Xaa-Pro dipeptidase